jgi:hypothetical protein
MLKMINKTKFTGVLLAMSLISFGQELPRKTSEKHIQIEGTNIFMVPPAAFQSSTNFKGFQDPKDQTSMIMVMEIPGPYLEVTKGFNAEMLKTRGMDLKTKKEIKVAGYDGLFIELDQPANGLIFSKQILIYGNEKATTLINGAFLKDSLQLGTRIKESMLSTVVDSKLKSDPRGALNYSLDETIGALKFHSVIGNGMLFNRDLKTPTESEDKASLITDKSFAKIQIENKKLFCISRVKKYPGDYSVISGKGINDIAMDDLSGFELFAKSNTSENEHEEMYQVILFDDDGGYYVFVGTYITGSENAITDIQNIIGTFKRKK